MYFTISTFIKHLKQFLLLKTLYANTNTQILLLLLFFLFVDNFDTHVSSSTFFSFLHYSLTTFIFKLRRSNHVREEDDHKKVIFFFFWWGNFMKSIRKLISKGSRIKAKNKKTQTLMKYIFSFGVLKLVFFYLLICSSLTK